MPTCFKALGVAVDRPAQAFMPLCICTMPSVLGLIKSASYMAVTTSIHACMLAALSKALLKQLLGVQGSIGCVYASLVVAC